MIIKSVSKSVESNTNESNSKERDSQGAANQAHSNQATSKESRTTPKENNQNDRPGSDNPNNTNTDSRNNDSAPEKKQNRPDLESNIDHNSTTTRDKSNNNSDKSDPVPEKNLQELPGNDVTKNVEIMQEIFQDPVTPESTPLEAPMIISAVTICIGKDSEPNLEPASNTPVTPVTVPPKNLATMDLKASTPENPAGNMAKTNINTAKATTPEYTLMPPNNASNANNIRQTNAGNLEGAGKTSLSKGSIVGIVFCTISVFVVIAFLFRRYLKMPKEKPKENEGEALTNIFLSSDRKKKYSEFFAMETGEPRVIIPPQPTLPTNLPMPSQFKDSYLSSERDSWTSAESGDAENILTMSSSPTDYYLEKKIFYYDENEDSDEEVK